MKSIVAFGNPLLDTIVSIKDDHLLKKYNYKNDDQKEISKEEMSALMEDIRTCVKTVSAGGCAQNTLKVMQWLLQKQCSTTIFGAIGDDKEGEVLQHILETHGVQPFYVKHKNFHTGLTVALVNGSNRSLVACLGAAEVLAVEDLSSDIIRQVGAANIVYIEGFFLTQRSSVAEFLLNYCNANKKIIAFNISGEYMCTNYPRTVQLFLEKATIIFGNRKEFQAVCSIMKYENVEKLLKHLDKNSKIVAVTDGAKPVLCVNGDGSLNINKIEVPRLGQVEIVDTTGAGDAFVAGFLVGHLLERTPEDSAKLGCYAAQEIIKRRGCTVPPYPPKVLV